MSRWPAKMIDAMRVEVSMRRVGVEHPDSEVEARIVQKLTDRALTASADLIDSGVSDDAVQAIVDAIETRRAREQKLADASAILGDLTQAIRDGSDVKAAELAAALSDRLASA